MDRVTLIDPETDTTLEHHPLNTWMFKLPAGDYIGGDTLCPPQDGLAYEHETYGWITRFGGVWWAASTDAEIRQQGGVTFT